MDGVEVEVCYGGLGARERLATTEGKRERKDDLQVEQRQYLWYDGCR